MEHRRRCVPLVVACIAVFLGARVRAAAEDQAGTRLILLGTKGGPRIDNPDRSNTSTLLRINGTPYVVDAGYGTPHRLLAAGVPLQDLRYLFITHHHSDHNMDYGPTLYDAWVAGRPGRVDAYGPTGLEAMTRAFFDYMRFDIETRMVDEGRPDPRTLFFAHDFDKPGIVLQNADVKVTAARVRHPPINDAYAYRFDTKGRSVVISGDTAYSPELIELARGADVLVHEILYLPALESLLTRAARNATRVREHLLASHTMPEDVGRVATQAGVKTLVLSHLIPGQDPSITDAQWAEGVRRQFSGRIVVGKDLLEIQ